VSKNGVYLFNMQWPGVVPDGKGRAFVDGEKKGVQKKEIGEN